MKRYNGLTLRAWLQAEPFTLTMSSGFFSFFAHNGMLSVLEEAGLMPQRITGASSGALVGACWAAGCQVAKVKPFLFGLSKRDFWDPGPGLGLLRGEKLRQIIRHLSPVIRLEDCLIPVAVSVFDVFTQSTHVLQTGLLAEAVYASSAMPPMFQPQWINKRLYWDGGIKDRPGLAGVSPNERVFYHHIASRSPWRRKDSPALRIPERDNMVSLAIQGLPRVSPNTLVAGQQAFAQARATTQQALDMPLNAVTLRLSASPNL